MSPGLIFTVGHSPRVGKTKHLNMYPVAISFCNSTVTTQTTMFQIQGYVVGLNIPWQALGGRPPSSSRQYCCSQSSSTIARAPARPHVPLSSRLQTLMSASQPARPRPPASCLNQLPAAHRVSLSKKLVDVSRNGLHL